MIQEPASARMWVLFVSAYTAKTTTIQSSRNSSLTRKITLTSPSMFENLIRDEKKDSYPAISKIIREDTMKTLNREMRQSVQPKYSA